MDKQKFEQEIFVQLQPGMGTILNAWHIQRQHFIKQLNPEQRSIDPSFIQAITLAGGIPTIAEERIPGIREKYRIYLEAQNQLLHDLIKLNKLVTNEMSPFREWLK